MPAVYKVFPGRNSDCQTTGSRIQKRLSAWFLGESDACAQLYQLFACISVSRRWYRRRCLAKIVIGPPMHRVIGSSFKRLNQFGFLLDLLL